MSPLILIGLGVALFAVAGRKKKPSKNGTKELPPPEPEPDPDVRDELAGSNLPGGTDIPSGMGHADAWVSDDCQAWAIGRDFFASHGDEVEDYYDDLVQGYLDTGNAALAELVIYTHPSEWDVRTFVEGAYTYDTPAMQWVREQLPLDCQKLVPEPQDFETFAAYDQAWATFAAQNPVLSEYVTVLAEFADDVLAELWMAEYGNEVYFEVAGEPITAFMEYEHRSVIRDVLGEAPDQSIEDVTDEAYARLYSDLEICPEVIDPDNPEHQFCQEIWLRLRDLATIYAEG